jgi:hypothetical protein
LPPRRAGGQPLHSIYHVSATQPLRACLGSTSFPLLTWAYVRWDVVSRGRIGFVISRSSAQSRPPAPQLDGGWSFGLRSTANPFPVSLGQRAGDSQSGPDRMGGAEGSGPSATHRSSRKAAEPTARGHWRDNREPSRPLPELRAQSKPERAAPGVGCAQPRHVRWRPRSLRTEQSRACASGLRRPSPGRCERHMHEDRQSRSLGRLRAAGQREGQETPGCIGRRSRAR